MKKHEASIWNNLGGTYDNVEHKKKKQKCEYCNKVLLVVTRPLDGKKFLKCPNCDYTVPLDF
jgi:hypothetical protein